jgi:biofilm protein TabA
MVLDRIDNAERSFSLHPGFAPAFAHLKTLDPASIAPGRYPVDGDRLFMIVQRGPGKGKEKTRLEAHKRFIDIQCTLSGTDLIGWMNIRQCAFDGLGYNEEKDIEFFSGQSDVWVPVPAGSFGIFFPEDVHAPNGAEEELFKIVLKVRVDWE